MAEPVKGKTDAGRRREQRARQTRERIVDAALTLFLDVGYVATTVDAIARAAEVAPATVYQAFGTKQAILARALDVEIAGDAEPVALLDRDWVKRARREPDARRRLAMVVQAAAAVAARTAALKEVMRDAAASDTAAAELIRRDHQRRHATQQTLVDVLQEAKPFRPGLDRPTAVATFYALVNSDTYRLLVEELGWTKARWTRWLVAVLDRQFYG